MCLVMIKIGILWYCFFCESNVVMFDDLLCKMWCLRLFLWLVFFSAGAITSFTGVTGFTGFTDFTGFTVSTAFIVFKLHIKTLSLVLTFMIQSRMG